MDGIIDTKFHGSEVLTVEVEGLDVISATNLITLS